jgi:hypothetical protein
VEDKLQNLRHRADLFGYLRRFLASAEMYKAHSREQLVTLIRGVDKNHVLSPLEINEYAGYVGVDAAGCYSLGRRHLIQRFKFEEDSENARIRALTHRASSSDRDLSAPADHPMTDIEEQLGKSKAALAARQTHERSLLSYDLAPNQADGYSEESANDVQAAMHLLEDQRRRRHRNEVSSKLHSSSGMAIFLSAVSAQFRECRDALSRDLRAIGNHVRVQEDFQQGPTTLIVTLQNYVAQCDRVIALVGNAYGLEPPHSLLPIGSPRRSYSQWEYFFAIGERISGPKMPRKELFVYVATEHFLVSQPVQESEEFAERQREFIHYLKGSGEDRRNFDSIDHLCRMVLRDGWQLAARPNP